eukprot:m.140033 g.140033  ORF g.140033 m.140033 type:complete len:442 (-) comp14027_c0_seq1:112-1437(-)
MVHFRLDQGSQDSQPAMFRANVLVALVGIAAGVSIEESGGSLTVNVDQGSSLNVQQQGGASEPVALVSDIAALATMIHSVNSTVAQVNASMLTGQGALGSRIDGVDQALLGATQSRAALAAADTNATLSRADLLAQLNSANAQIAGLVAAINAIADCTGTTCVPRIAVCNLSSLGAGLSARGLSVTMPALVNGGAAVSVGGALQFASSTGYYLPSTAARSITCTGHGWSGVVPTPARCIANCAVCSGPTGCSMCSSGFVVNVSAPFTTLTLTGAQVNVSPRGVGANRQRPPTAANLAIGKNNLVDTTIDAGLWYTNIYYDGRSCTDPAWVEVDLGTQQRVGSVTTWMYWLDSRRYCGQRILVSQTGAFTGEETQIYSTPGTDYGHVETSAGNTVYANGVVGRYVRFWSSRSNMNAGVHFVAIRISAAPVISASTATCSATS